MSEQNAASIERDLTWITKVIDARFKLYFGKETEVCAIEELQPPKHSDGSLYAQVINHYKMDLYERLILIVALIPHIRPQLLDIFFIKNSNYDRGFSEFGGLKGVHHSGFLPTGETVAFLMAGNDLKKRFSLVAKFQKEHFFQRDNIIKLEMNSNDEPALSGKLILSGEYLSYFTTGRINKPDFSANFPAKLISTERDWVDLILPSHTIEEIEELNAWIKYEHVIMNEWGLKKKLTPGYRVMFYGKPGTGKTFTASLLGKENGLDVYRIDLSMVVSKYIGETEKNLANVFDMAENKNWILFFDEADALFGKRTQTKDAHDRYANQEVSYLLQRIEDFPGLVILATNLKSNLDDAFARRFQAMIHFPMPDAGSRLKIWENAFNGALRLAGDVDLERVANDYEISGGGIMNVLRYSSLMSLKHSRKAISIKDIRAGVRKELVKEGKTVG